MLVPTMADATAAWMVESKDTTTAAKMVEWKGMTMDDVTVQRLVVMMADVMDLQLVAQMVGIWAGWLGYLTVEMMDLRMVELMADWTG